jgi:hypothetical protein
MTIAAMSQALRTVYDNTLSLALDCVARRDQDNAMEALRVAMRCANQSKDARYRRAVFRAMSFARRLPA